MIAAEALRSPEIRRLMTVPGVNVITAATFMAAIGEIARFPVSPEAGRLPGARSEGAPVGGKRREPGADLKAGLRLGPPCAGRGIVEGDPKPGPDPGLL